MLLAASLPNAGWVAGNGPVSRGPCIQGGCKPKGAKTGRAGFLLHANQITSETCLPLVLSGTALAALPSLLKVPAERRESPACRRNEKWVGCRSTLRQTNVLSSCPKRCLGRETFNCPVRHKICKTRTCITSSRPVSFESGW